MERGQKQRRDSSGGSHMVPGSWYLIEPEAIIEGRGRGQLGGQAMPIKYGSANANVLWLYAYAYKMRKL